MTTFKRRIAGDEETTLDSVESAARAKFKKADVSRSQNTVTVSAKVLWQSQTTTFTADNGVLEVSGNNNDSVGRGVKIIDAIDDYLDDQGWQEALKKYETTSTKSKAIRNQVLNAIDPSEQIIIAIQGLELDKTKIIVATTSRVLLLEKSTWGFSSGTRTINLGKISSLTTSKGMLFADVVITTSNEDIKVEKVAQDEADHFVRAVQELLDSSESSLQQPEAADNLGQLSKLADLHAAGVLTDDEFSAAKSKILGL